MKFEKIEPGMILYDRHKYRMGNTTMRTLGEWPVGIVSVDRERRSAMVCWNGNPAECWYASDLEKLKTWSQRDECAEVEKGAFCVYAVRLKKGHKAPLPKFRTKP